MPQFAANLSLLYTELPFLERLAAARQAGFRAVTFLFPYACDPDQLNERLHRHGLRLVLHSMPAGNWANGDRGMACDPRRIDEFRDAVRQALDFASELEVPRVHCMAGIMPGGLAPERARETFIENLQYAADQMLPQGIDVLIEAIDACSIPGYFLHDSGQALDILAACDRKNLFLQYAVQRHHKVEQDGALRSALPLIRHIRLVDRPQDAVRDDGESSERALCALLDEHGYADWLGYEYLPEEWPVHPD